MTQSTNKYNFFVSSINDIQLTIRAIDNKLIALLVLLILPITKLDVLITVFIKLIDWNAIYGYASISIFTLIWVTGLIMTFLGIISIENPSKHIKGANSFQGIFYSVGDFKIKKIQMLFSSKITTSLELTEMIENADVDDNQIFRELIFEQTKLSFIRNLKAKRQKAAIIFIVLAVFIFLANWTLILTQTFTK